MGGLCGTATVVGGAIAFFHFAETHRQLVAVLAKTEWINWTIETVFSLALSWELCAEYCALPQCDTFAKINAQRFSRVHPKTLRSLVSDA